MSEGKHGPNGRRRVVVTGLGMVCPTGTGVEKAWENLIAGRSGIGPITRFDASEFATRFAGECSDFDPAEWLPRKEIKRNDRFIHFALAAAKMALEHSGLEITEANAERIGTFVGSGMGGLGSIEATLDVLRQKGPSRISPFFIPQTIINLAPGQISIHFGTKYGNLSQVSACATGAHAIGEAAMHIALGRCDAMIAGGAEATITELGIGGFNAMRALSTRNEDPQGASRPFDKDRDGFVAGEGAGILILEAEEHAKARGAEILAYLDGYGLTSDAYHVTSPAPEGEGAARCMRMALEDAGLAPEAIDYINAHGTSTEYNDKLETAAIKTVFGDHAYDVPVSSTKSMTGHLLGAAGAVEAVITVMALRRGILPPTINYTTPDPECDLDYVPNEAREVPIRAALSNSLGFGGTNATLIFTKPS
ncbi:MAG: beta-ketoacyl-[acyl-carrier-protein] synthase II [Deltaproteobacteria bacterium]|nr:MAG: beta-ketoacyl-[acyl-carrier-protein] synthase II [Deltaproteobacteria bacterium]